MIVKLFNGSSKCEMIDLRLIYCCSKVASHFYEPIIPTPYNIEKAAIL